MEHTIELRCKDGSEDDLAVLLLALGRVGFECDVELLSSPGRNRWRITVRRAD